MVAFAHQYPHHPRVVIVGAGAVGSVLASALEGRAELLVADTCACVRSAYRDQGIVALDPVSDLPGLAFLPGDIVVLATRATAAAEAAAAIPGDVPLICVANGFNNSLLESRPETVLFGVVDFAATTVAPGRARCTRRGSLTLQRRSPRDATARLAACLDRSIVRPCLTDDIEGHRWSKLLLNTSLDPVAAMTNSTFGAVFADRASFGAFRALLHEGVRVARAANHRLHAVSGCSPSMLDAVLHVPVLSALAARCAARTARSVQSTMVADLQRGARTEVEFLNAHLVATADRLGVPVPAHRRVLELLTDIHCARRQPHRSLARRVLLAA